jgi:hypothetical protein
MYICIIFLPFNFLTVDWLFHVHNMEELSYILQLSLGQAFCFHIIQCCTDEGIAEKEEFCPEQGSMESVNNILHELIHLKYVLTGVLFYYFLGIRRLSKKFQLKIGNGS